MKCKYESYHQINRMGHVHIDNNRTGHGNSNDNVYICNGTTCNGCKLNICYDCTHQCHYCNKCLCVKCIFYKYEEKNQNLSDTDINNKIIIVCHNECSNECSIK